MMTISQGGARQMAIEGYAGRWHTGVDNEMESRSSVIPTVSHWPMPDPLPETTSRRSDGRGSDWALACVSQ